MQPSAIVLLTVLLLELVNSCTGWWRGGICIKIIFTVLFVFHLVRAAWLVAKNQQDSIRAEMLREELKNSRIVLAMSQIRTHFVFNILNAISGMCEYDPQKADETLVMFAHYLRSNINIMEEDEPEAFTKSLEHLEKYVFLEQVRFGEKIQFAKKKLRQIISRFPRWFSSLWWKMQSGTGCFIRSREEPSSCTHGRKTATASLRFPMTVWGLTWQMHQGRNLSE